MSDAAISKRTASGTASDLGDRASVDPPPVVVGAGGEFSGLLALARPGRIEGRVSGRIVADDALWIGETAAVEADVKAGSVVVAGTLRGDVRARERIALRASARVQGSLYAPKLILEEGSVLNGTCQSGEEPPGPESGTASA